MAKAGYMPLDFAFFFEPEKGIRTPQDFSRELEGWACREGRCLTLVQASMEPCIELDGQRFVCRLGDPRVARQNNFLWKKLFGQGFTHSVGPFLGYQWVYLYKI